MRRNKVFESYRRGQVVFADLGYSDEGVQGGIRPCVIVSCDKSNHFKAPQITVCPLSSKIKENKVHVQLHPLDVNGYHLRQISDMLPEDIQTIAKKRVRGTIGFIENKSEIMKKRNAALIMQLRLGDDEDGEYSKTR